MNKTDKAYVLWKRELPPGVCKCIIDIGISLPNRKARVFGSQARKIVNQKKRHSLVSWWNSDHWISGIMAHHLELANERNWHCNIVKTSGTQFSIYRSGHYFDWHSDTFDCYPQYRDDNRKEQRQRVLSVIIVLSEESSYEGGELELIDDSGNLILGKEKLSQGSVLVFPSGRKHRVKTIRSGERYSLVSWALGEFL